MTLDDFTLHADKPDALYFAVDLADADLDEFGKAMLKKQESRRFMRTCQYKGEHLAKLTALRPPEIDDPMVCPEKPRTEKCQSRQSTRAALNAPVLESGATIAAAPAPPATEIERRRWLCTNQSCETNSGPRAFTRCKLLRCWQHDVGFKESCPCGGTNYIVRVDESGREIVPWKGKRYFAPSAPTRFPATLAMRIMEDGIKTERLDKDSRRWEHCSCSPEQFLGWLRNGDLHDETESAVLALLWEGR